MATGDIKNNLRKLVKELKYFKYPIKDVELKGISVGTPASFLPILHHVFLDFSVDLTEFFAKDYELYGKSDLRFIETVYRILRDEFDYKPLLTREQFLSIGFAERKILLICDVLKKCRDKIKQLNPKASTTDKNIVKKAMGYLPGESKQSYKKVLHQNQSLNSSTTNVSKRQITDPLHDKRYAKDTGKPILKENDCDGKENCEDEEQKVSGKDHGQLLTFPRKPLKTVRWETDDKGDSSDQSKSGFENNALQPIVALPPRVIPAPVSIATVPKPSPDLMLTPLTKSGHQEIPLSSSKQSIATPSNDVSLIDLTESVCITQPKVVKHTEIPADEKRNKLPQKDEMNSLKALVNKLQDQVCTVLAQNNEMSARIVLLENKVKFLEEKNTKVLTSTKEHGVGTIASGIKRNTEYDTRRPLLGDFNKSLNTLNRSLEESPKTTVSPSIIEISDTAIDMSTASPEDYNSSSQHIEVISPLKMMSDIHLKFADQTTTATILNVERRLKETKAMLANATRPPSSGF